MKNTKSLLYTGLAVAAAGLFWLGPVQASDTAGTVVASIRWMYMCSAPG